MKTSKTAARSVHSLSQPRSAFTLIELLSVIAVSALLMTMSAPLLTSVLRSSTLTQAGNKLVDLTALARQTALNKNTITALIVVSKLADSSGKQAVALVEYDALQKQWTRLGAWERLPEAVEAVDSPTDKAAATDLASAIAPLNLSLGGASLSSFPYSSLVFYPDGRLATSTAAATNVRKLKVRFTQGNQTDNFYDLDFNTDTSAVRIVQP
jgi:prepilin-type N-terminal cleavage/methylation domain-containing protein